MRLSAAAAFGESPVRSREQAITVLREAVRAGVNHLDTAAFYFSGLQSANTLIAAALTPYPADLVIATKVGPARGRSGEWLPTATPEQLRGQVEENLRQLGRDHLDLVYLRRAADMDSVGAHVAALAQLRAAGLIRHLGLSGVSLADLREAQEIAPVVSVQNRYGVEARDEAANELLATCGAEGIAFVPFFTIAGAGRHRGPPAQERPAVLAVAAAHGASAAQVRLAWTLGLGSHVLAIPGTGDPVHLRENVAAAALRLTPAEHALLGASPPAPTPAP
jgi:pyridoxine 4-dehydrogenase